MLIESEERRPSFKTSLLAWVVTKFFTFCGTKKFITGFTGLLFPILCQINPVHIHLLALKCWVTLFIHVYLYLRSGLCLSNFPVKLCAFVPLMPHTPYILTSLTLIIFGKENKLWSSSWHVLQFPVIASILSPDSLCHMLSDTLILCYPVSVRN